MDLEIGNGMDDGGAKAGRNRQANYQSLNGSSRREEALISVVESMSLLTSAATRFVRSNG